MHHRPSRHHTVRNNADDGGRSDRSFRASVCVPPGRFIVTGRKRWLGKRRHLRERIRSDLAVGGVLPGRRGCICISCSAIEPRTGPARAGGQGKPGEIAISTTLSHELRTPLHGVLGYADQLSNDAELDPAKSRQVTEIANAAKHMRDIVNLVLDFARIEALRPRRRCGRSTYGCWCRNFRQPARCIPAIRAFIMTLGGLTSIPGAEVAGIAATRSYAIRFRPPALCG